MKTQTKIIKGCPVRKSSEHPRMWEVMETRAGQQTGKVTFRGTLAEIRAALS